MSFPGVMDSSSMNNDVRYGDLFPLFDNAQDYFTVTHEEAFDKLLSKTNQLPRKFGRAKICCEQLKQRYLIKLRSIEKRMQQMAFLEEQLKSQCENLQQIEANLKNEISEHRVRHEEQTERYLEVLNDYVRLDLDYAATLKGVVDNSIERLDTKLSTKDVDLVMSNLSDWPDQMKGSGDSEPME